MITADPHPHAVLAHYPPACQPSGSLESLGAAGGYSGARFWRFIAPAGSLLLRRWPPEHPSIQRLQFIQAVLWHVRQEGFQRAALPLETSRHAGFVEHGGHLWELTPWMPGRADYHARPSPARLHSAMCTLAEFHVAAASFPLPETAPMPSPAVGERIKQLDELLAGGFVQLQNAIDHRRWPEFADRALRLLQLASSAAPKVWQLLQSAKHLQVRLPPCIRDIWHDHVLFEGDEVSAFVDFGALRPETVSADISRLLGSLVADDPIGWTQGLAAYQEVRSLSTAEHQLIPALDASSTLLSGLNWVRWVYVERCHFDSPAAIVTRLDILLARLLRLIESR